MPAPTQLPPIEWRAALGGQFDSDSHGIADFGLRRPNWSVELLTDTLDARWTPHAEDWHAWLGVRAEGGAAGLFITPWTDGAPDPTRARSASYGGLNGGYVRHGPNGLYGGLSASARVVFFGAREETTVEVQGPTMQVSAEGMLGLWRPELQAWVSAGGITVEGGVSPTLRSELHYHPDLPITPFIDLYAGAAIGSDELSRTRLGGLVPYVVPVAGAAWAEWWVEDYATARLGVEAEGPVGPLIVRFAPFADLATFDSMDAIGLGGAFSLRWGRLFLDTQVGHAPWILRQEGISRTSVYALAGMDWGKGRIGPP